MNQTYELPQKLGDLMGAYDSAHWQTAVLEIKAGIGVLERGTILASGSGGDIGKLVKLTAGTEASAYGVLLDPSIAKAGSFKGSALRVPTGVGPRTDRGRPSRSRYLRRAKVKGQSYNLHI